MEDPILNIAMIISETISEGPGKRFALWVQGCPFRCKGCCNQSFLPFSGGTERSVSSILEEIRKSKETHGIEGISLLGGEPFAQSEALEVLIRGVKKLGLSVMVFSGFTMRELQKKQDPATDSILSLIDLLVDGRFVESQLDKSRRWIGSKNQEMHFLSDRYNPEDPIFKSKNTIELRVINGKVIINGWPEATLIRKEENIK